MVMLIWEFIRGLLDALDANGPHVRSHDGKQLITAG
jgi:hypothetical protein